MTTHQRKRGPTKAERRLAVRIANFEKMETTGSNAIKSLISRGGMKRPGSLKK